jgi:NAD(P)-dependent dehydrogenase (short-subunit alcohol dehydrogenase family)
MVPQLFNLTGKVALVTGGSKGLGKAMARGLAEAGADIVISSRHEDELRQAIDEIMQGTGRRGSYLVADMTKRDQVKQLAKTAVERMGRVDILINNAGINCRKNITDFTLEEWRSVMDTNVTAAFLMCRSFIPLMRGTGYGRIINMSSIMSWVSLPQRAAYSASKSALLGMTRAVALELAAEGITCNGISPGPFATEMNKPLLENPEANAQFLANIPLGRWGKVEEIGKLAVYLCSEEAGFITGTDILIDGGWTAK